MDIEDKLSSLKEYEQLIVRMISIELTSEEIRYLIQSLEFEREQYLNQFGSCKLGIVRDLAQRAVEQNNLLIQKLETVIGERVPF